MSETQPCVLSGVAIFCVLKPEQRTEVEPVSFALRIDQELSTNLYEQPRFVSDGQVVFH